MKRLIVTIFPLFLCFAGFSQGKSINPDSPAAMHQLSYCLFYDNHTMPACPDVGESFVAEAFTDRVKACGVDYLTFHERCNQGMAYYNTEIGIWHPSLKKDFFCELADACQRKGIALIAYLTYASAERNRRQFTWRQKRNPCLLNLLMVMPKSPSLYAKAIP